MTVVTKGHTLKISGSTASGITVQGGDVQVISGGEVVGTTVNTGTLTIGDGGFASNTTVHLNGFQLVDAGGMAELTTITKGGSQGVYHGGTVISTTLVGGGQTLTGGTASASFLVDSAAQSLFEGAKAVDTSVSDGGFQAIYSGIAIDTKVGNGGEQLITPGGTVSKTNISKGGVMVDNTTHSVTGVSVLNGGLVYLAGGTFQGTVASGGTVIVDPSAGVERFTKLYSGLTASNGEQLIVKQDGMVSASVVEKGGTLTVSSGGTAEATQIHGGIEVVSSGGTIDGRQTFTTGGQLTIKAAKSVAFSTGGFTGTDKINLDGFAFASTETKSFHGNGAGTGGTLTVTDGALKATVTLFGQYIATGFHLARDAAGGTAITYTAPAAHFPELLAGHR
jgi:autotransporter passenger strand-loop-strand repeat protein